jgi:two-component system cell cycle sensor histidine kinase/response regulator CckA
VLAGGVAHEVNNMMTVVLGHSELLLESSLLPESTRTDIGEIRKAAQHAAMVTQQLLAFSRRGLYRPVSIGLDALLGDLATIVRQLLGSDRPLTLSLRCPHPVRIDEGHFKQIIVNLALNARDAMPTGGMLTLSAATEVVLHPMVGHAGSLIPAGRYGVVVVRDTGAGIDPQIMPRIFDPFFTTKAVGEGTGLGLAAVSGLLAQNGGFIRVESVVGKGTAFILYLPLLPETAIVEPEAEAPRSSLEELAGRKILVVDDEPTVLTVTCQVLAKYGMHVLQAGSGEEALELVDREGAPDVVLTDLTMPGIDGVELARRLEARWPGLSIILMSGHAKETLVRRVAIGRHVLLIRKPFTIEDLGEKVKEALDRGRRPPEPGPGE